MVYTSGFGYSPAVLIAFPWVLSPTLRGEQGGSMGSSVSIVGQVRSGVCMRACVRAHTHTILPSVELIPLVSVLPLTT